MPINSRLTGPQKARKGRNSFIDVEARDGILEHSNTLDEEDFDGDDGELGSASEDPHGSEGKIVSHLVLHDEVTNDSGWETFLARLAWTRRPSLKHADSIADSDLLPGTNIRMWEVPCKVKRFHRVSSAVRC